MKKIKFITGPAGTGKSHLLKGLLEKETRPHLICAPTGIASVAIGGSTLHRTFKINSDSGYVGKRWRGVEVVYIDEASMMGAKLFEAVLQGAPDAEFVLVGDMAQLPPVKDKYWFESHYAHTYNIYVERLTKQWRQKDDDDFSEVLNSVRNGTVTRDHLRGMYMASVHPDDNEGAVTLAYRNDTVRAINAEKLLQLYGESVTLNATYSGVMKENDCIADSSLILKNEAKIIFINNDPDGRWSNGTHGYIESILDDHLVVIVNNKIEIVTKHKWLMKLPVELTPMRMMEIEGILNDPTSLLDKQELRHALATGIEYVVSGICEQFPVKLAYALTVHKSQGMTLDYAHIVMSGFAGCYGIGYVATSRVRSIGTISFDRKPVPADFKFDKRLTDFI